MQKLDLREVFADDPEILAALDRKEQTALLKEIVKQKQPGALDILESLVPLFRGEKGDSIVGEKGEKGDKGDPGVGIQGIPGRNGRDGRDGKDGADGVSPSISEIAKAVKLPETKELDVEKLYTGFIERIIKEQPIDISQIRNAQSFMFNGKRYKFEELMHGGGDTVAAGNNITITTVDGRKVISSTGSGVTIETPVGVVNAVNTVFTVSATPTFVIADGITYFQNSGYTLVGLTITMDVPPSQYIRAAV